MSVWVDKANESCEAKNGYIQNNRSNNPAYLGQLPQHIGSLAFVKFSEKAIVHGNLKNRFL